MRQLRRRRLPESTDNHERWLISYADFITLLFAFFVVMYSISTVSEGSYRVLSDSIVAAFNNPRLALQPIQVGELVRTSVRMVDSPDEVSEQPVLSPLRNPERGDGMGEQTADPQQQLGALAGAVEDRVERLIDDKLVRITRNKNWLEIELKSKLLFPSGSRVLLSDAVPILESFAEVLRQVPNRISVEGYTDNQPIRNGQFPSNWELSATRASSVVRLFEANGVPAERMAAIGHGENRPVAANDTEEGRASNRRVVLVITALVAGPQDEPEYEFNVESEG